MAETKYFIETGYGRDGERAWFISEVHEVKDQGKWKVGRYGNVLSNFYFSGTANTSTGLRHAWRFRDNAWECAAILIKILFNGNMNPSGDEPWLELKA